MKTIAERKSFLTKGIDKLKTSYGNELWLAIEGRFTNLRIWIGNEKCVADGGGRRMVYMRLDCANQYSIPFDEKHCGYLEKDNPIINKLVKKYQFQSPIEALDEILELTKGLKHRTNVVSW